MGEWAHMIKLLSYFPEAIELWKTSSPFGIVGFYIGAGIVALIWSLLTYFNIVNNVKLFHYGTLRLSGVIVRSITMAISALLLVVSGVLFFFLGEVASLSSDVLSPDLYVEILISLVLGGYLHYRFLSNPDSLDPDEDFDQTVEDLKVNTSGILKIPFLAILTLVFLFTDFETFIVQWGVVLFGKTLGAWLFSYYLAWSTYYLLQLFLFIVQWLVMFLFGNPIKVLDDADK